MSDSALRNRSFLVTGGAGFLGSHVVHRLRERGCTRIGVPRSRDFDLTRPKDIDAMFDQMRPEIIIHLAAACGGIGVNREKPGEFFYRNLVMGAQLMETARQRGVRKFVAVGTVCAYPKLAPVPFVEHDLWNGYPEETNAPYGLAKKMLLVQAQAYRRQYGLDAIYLLPTNLYGPADNFDLGTSHVIPALIRKFVEARDAGKHYVTCWGTGEPSREFMYVDDAASGIVLATELYESAEPVNLGTGREIRILELAETIRNLVGFTGDIRWDASKPDGQPRRRLDTSRAETHLGFLAQTGLEEGLRRTICWYEGSREAQSSA